LCLSASYEHQERTLKMSTQILKTAAIDRLLTQKEVQEITRHSSSTLEQNRSKGVGIPWVRLGTRAIRYRESAVVEYCASLTGQV